MLNLEFDGKGTAENGSFQVFSSISIGKHATHAPFCDKGGKGAWNLSQKGGRDDKKGMGKWQIRLGFFPYYLYRATVPPSL
jgi:hypothetical protein